MGVTKALSIKKSAINQEGILRYTLRSVTPVLCSYIVATFVYSYRGTLDYNALLTKILDFSACGVFYFIEYFLILSLWAPLLYVIIRSFICKKIQIKYKLILGFFIFMLIWRVGYLSMDGWNIFGQSYLFVYSIGLLIGQIELPKIKWIYCIPGFMVLLAGLLSTKRFYWARMTGIHNYSGGIDILAPKLQLNPPNISIIIYSFGIIAVAYVLFEMSNNSNVKALKIAGIPFSVLGKYSMDIFLWHLYIQEYLNGYFISMEKNVIKWFIYYGAMFSVPIITRYLYNKAKTKVYQVIQE